MNKITKRKWMILIIILLITTEGIYAYDPFSSGNKRPLSLSSPSYKETGLFGIDPGTILSSLEKGMSDVFLPDSRLLDDRYSGPITYNKPVVWSQADNLKIVSALNTYVWKDTLNDWKLFRMIFNVVCQDNINGLPGGIFTYFATTFDKGKIIDTWREVEIDPEYSLVAWGGGAKFPHPILGRKDIDLSRLKVTAEEAIRIAEENGGRNIRLKAKNQCSIHLTLLPEVYKGWQVTYNTTDAFEIFIDPYTGEIIK